MQVTSSNLRRVAGRSSSKVDKTTKWATTSNKTKIGDLVANSITIILLFLLRKEADSEREAIAPLHLLRLLLHLHRDLDQEEEVITMVIKRGRRSMDADTEGQDPLATILNQEITIIRGIIMGEEEATIVISTSIMAKEDIIIIIDVDYESLVHFYILRVGDCISIYIYI